MLMIFTCMYVCIFLLYTLFPVFQNTKDFYQYQRMNNSNICIVSCLSKCISIFTLISIQQVDQFSFANTDTFLQRFLINDDHWEENGGPIFFYAGNEGDITLFAENTVVVEWFWCCENVFITHVAFVALLMWKYFDITLLFFPNYHVKDYRILLYFIIFYLYLFIYLFCLFCSDIWVMYSSFFQGFMWDIAPEFKALILFGEHRYYGLSEPYGNNSLTVSILGTLHFTTLHFPFLHYTSLHFTSLHFTSLHFTVTRLTYLHLN